MRQNIESEKIQGQTKYRIRQYTESNEIQSQTKYRVKQNTESDKKYKVQHANSERLKKSSIIAMQKMLSHDTKK